LIRPNSANILIPYLLEGDCLLLAQLSFLLSSDINAKDEELLNKIAGLLLMRDPLEEVAL